MQSVGKAYCKQESTQQVLKITAVAVILQTTGQLINAISPALSYRSFGPPRVVTDPDQGTSYVPQGVGKALRNNFIFGSYSLTNTDLNGDRLTMKKDFIQTQRQDQALASPIQDLQDATRLLSALLYPKDT